MKLKSLCVYCGSSPGLRPSYIETADAFGRLLATEGITLVYGGGNVGLMGALADSALAAGGRVIGVIPKRLVARELAHDGLTELHRVESMHERKLKMAELSDAFVALPGGVGTLEEIFEVATWTQLGIQSKPCAFLDVDGYYAPLFQFLEHMSEQRFIKKEHLVSLIRTPDPAELLSRLRDHTPATFDKWIDRVRNKG
ncbi:MAG TPA: TIGR00730 family Rossman fold protein [Candidatus Acidoferrum sp.]|nr:TIGR00730 family Rossman fold protein [Candidatus Acidoferrum sp.]